MQEYWKKGLFFEKLQAIFNNDYITILSRIKTFEGWKFENIQNSQALADCGFYSIQDRDLVRCFHCGVVLGFWTLEDIPWMEHYSHSPKCLYINLNKIRVESRQILQSNLENTLKTELIGGKFLKI